MRPSRRAAVALLGLIVAAAGCETTGLSTRIGGVGGGVGIAVDSVTRLATAAPTMKGAFSDLDEPQEVELGRAVTAAIGARYRLLRDPELTRYVALVGNAVAARSARPDLRYYFGVLDTPEVNAFAAPGGFVFITRGALGLLRDEAMLAAVLGHEVGHVALRHHVATIKAQKRKELALLGLQEGVSHTGAAPFSSAIASGADLVAEQVVLKGHSRAEEAEADQVGFDYAAGAGYDPAGLRDFLSALLARGGQDTALSRFFSTHPGLDERRGEQDRRLQERPGGGVRNAERFARSVGAR
ncbi:MAG: M48 family metalloprotease [Candidatus Rokubacteria bacterium]|nr:M48 family metalloprotease [Candidatus Rokubacteria bacterium]